MSRRGAQPSPGLRDGQAPEALLVPPTQAMAAPARARVCTHHADLSRHEVAQSVEPLHIRLQVLGLVAETGLGKTEGLGSASLSGSLGTRGQFMIIAGGLENVGTLTPSTSTNDSTDIFHLFSVHLEMEFNGTY